MLHSLERLIEFLLRKGVIPICSGGASTCFALYSAQMARGADQWSESVSNQASSLYRDSIHLYSVQLRQHSGASLCLSLISASIAVEGYRDWQLYSNTKNWQQLALTLWKRQQPLPFFFRVPVLMTTVASLLLTRELYGGWIFWQPEAPIVLQKNKLV